MKIHLLHTNDIHSQIENHLRLTRQIRTMRTAFVATGDVVLTFDLGDVLDRVRPETEATYGQINAQMLGASNLDGWVFGNNEGLTIPVVNWPNLVAASRTTVFGTNIRQLDGKPFPFFTNWKIFEANGVKIGVFGLTPNYEGPYRMLGVKVEDPQQVAALAVKTLARQGCTVVVCLSHLGLSTDRRLAECVPGIHVILGGHTHQFMERAEYVGQTAIFQPGKHGFVFGHTVVDYDLEQANVISITSTPIAVEPQGAYDAEMFIAYQDGFLGADNRLHTPVACLNQPLPVAFDRESIFANLLVDALFAEYPCDLGLMMSGALTASLLPGHVQLEHVHGACPTPTRPILMSLCGASILQIVKSGITELFYHRPGIGFGFRGAVVGYLVVANMEIELVLVAGQMRVASVTIAGQPLVGDRIYRVVTCEYLWLAPVFAGFKQGTNIEFGRPLVREVLMKHLGEERMVDQARLSRYHLRSSKAHVSP